MAGNDEPRASRSVSLSKVESLLKEERKTIIRDISNKISDELSDSLLKQLTSSLTKTLTETIINTIKETLLEFQNGITTVMVDVDKNKAEISQIKTMMEDLRASNEKQGSDIQELINDNNNLKLQISELMSVDSGTRLHDIIPDKVSELEERLEERTNRQLRQTLVFRGIKENDKETWADTKQILSDIIAKTCDIAFEEAFDMINRTHRSAPNPRNKGNRNIFANIYCWDDCERIIKDFRLNNINNTNFHISVNYKYGPLTTARRAESLSTRWSLKKDKSITKGFIAYPAKLMVIFNGDNAYKLYKDFSKDKVDFDLVERRYKVRKPSTGTTVIIEE